jgi:vitamin B12 transporter
LKGLRFSVTAFYNRVGQAIANVTTGVNLRQRQNVDAIRARGLEFSAGADVGRFSVDGSLAVTDSRVLASGAQSGLNGLRPAQTPKLAGSATLAWKPKAGWQAALIVRHIGAQFEDDLQTSVLPAATTFGAFVNVPLRQFYERGVSLVLRGENLGDALVQTRNQAGSIDYGVPRTVWAGLRFGGGR